MKKTHSKTLLFLKRNAVYFILSLCILAVGLSVTLMLVNRDATIDTGSIPVEKPDDSGDGSLPDDNPASAVITFVLPVNNATSIGEYSESMVFNQTLNRYSGHLAIDFFAPEGTEVLAVYDGTVESVTNTLLYGTTVVIDHGNGLKTVYNSLLDGEKVVVGQTVKQGDAIGEVSSTNRQEYKDGPHLHFSVEENGKTIDPVKYLSIDEK